MKPVLVHRDRSGKFVSRRPAGMRRRRFRRNPANDPASVEADAALQAISEAAEKAEKARKALVRYRPESVALVPDEVVTASPEERALVKAFEQQERALVRVARDAQRALQRLGDDRQREAELATRQAEAAAAQAAREENAEKRKLLDAEARKAAAEARKALAEAQKAEQEAAKAAQVASDPASATPPAKRAPRQRFSKDALQKRAQRLRRRARQVKDPGLKSVYNQRASALSLRVRKSKLSKRAQQAMQAHGITRVNPGLRGVTDQLKILAPKLAMTAVAAAGAYGAGSWYADKTKSAESPFMRKYGAAVGTGGFSAVAFLLARMVAPRYSAAVLSGGIAATVVQVLLARREAAALPPPPVEDLSAGPVAGYVALNGAPSATEFASPSAMEILDRGPAGSLSGSIFD